jgi:hypothetical protein
LSYCYSSPRNLQREYPPHILITVCWIMSERHGYQARGHIFKLRMHCTDYTALQYVAHPHGQCASPQRRTDWEKKGRRLEGTALHSAAWLVS